MLLNLGPDLPPITSRLTRLPDGVAGVRETLKIMSALARDGKKKLPIRLAAMAVVQDLQQRDWAGEVQSLFNFVRDRIRFVGDINRVETLQDPARTLQLRAGDCDDKSTLLAAMLESIGHPARFHAVGFRPGKFSHVYVETIVGRRWLGLDPTEPWPAGRTTDRAVTHMIVNVTR
jgi:transglutaminase-like putative cysteine protease